MALAAWEYMGTGGVSSDLGSRTATGATDHVDMLGRTGRAYVSVVNGATNPVVVEVQGSHDATSWGTLVLEVDNTGTPVTQKSVAAATTDFVFLDPRALPRFVRVNVATANANGSRVVVAAERDC